MKKPTGKIITSILGAIFIAGILVLVNTLASSFALRLDLTDNKIYTLSTASEKILANLTKPVTLRFYFSKTNKQMPVQLKTFANRVEDLLQEYKQAGKGKLHLEKLDPKPFSDAEDSAILDGVASQNLSTGEKIYLGIAVSCGKKTVAIPFLSPNAENLLEYKITAAISEVFRTNKPTIGIMSALPVMGGPPSQEMIKMGFFKMTKPWLIVKELQKNFNVVKIPLNVQKIEKIDLLLLIHPSGISNSAQFAIDQFILKGGNMLAFLDPLSFFAATMQKAGRQKKGQTSSTLNRLLAAWNIKFNTKRTVADAVFARKIKTKTQALNYLTVLDITKKGMEKNDVVTSQLNALTLVFAGSFEGKPSNNLKKDVLLSTTADSCQLSTKMANNPQICFRNFKADPKKYDIAIRLTGKFKTAFPEGNPDIPKKASKNKNKVSKKTSLKEGRESASVILVGDSDIIYDEICVRIQQIFNQKIKIPMNDNLSFAQNIADSMCGNKEMIGIRCRPVVQRPFEEVKKIQADAEKEYKEKILELEKKLRKTERKLNIMQKNRRDANRKKFLSKAQLIEMKKFKTQQIEIRKQIKNIQKEFRQKIDSLENQLKWFNIIMMPFIIFCLGIGVAIYRKARNSAK